MRKPYPTPGVEPSDALGSEENVNAFLAKKPQPMAEMTVELGHCRNPDIGGYWSDPIDPAKKRRVPVADLADAVRVCEAFISRNGLGGGNWNAGRVFEAGKQVAKVSFNGRLWDMQGVEIAQAGLKTAAQHRAECWKDFTVNEPEYSI